MSGYVHIDHMCKNNLAFICFPFFFLCSSQSFTVRPQKSQVFSLHSGVLTISFPFPPPAFPEDALVTDKEVGDADPLLFRRDNVNGPSLDTDFNDFLSAASILNGILS